MTETVLRGRLLTFHRRPEGADDSDAYTYVEDGALLIRVERSPSAGRSAKCRTWPPGHRSPITART